MPSQSRANANFELESNPKHLLVSLFHSVSRDTKQQNTQRSLLSPLPEANANANANANAKATANVNANPRLLQMPMRIAGAQSVVFLLHSHVLVCMMQCPVCICLQIPIPNSKTHNSWTSQGGTTTRSRPTTECKTSSTT